MLIVKWAIPIIIIGKLADNRWTSSCDVCIQSDLKQAEDEKIAAKERAVKQLEEARKLTGLKDSDKELPANLQTVCSVYVFIHRPMYIHIHVYMHSMQSTTTDLTG